MAAETSPFSELLERRLRFRFVCHLNYIPSVLRQAVIPRMEILIALHPRIIPNISVIEIIDEHSLIFRAVYRYNLYLYFMSACTKSL